MAIDWDLFFSELEEAFEMGSDDEERLSILEKSFKREDIFSLTTAYECLKRALVSWIDTEEKYYETITIWAIGSYFLDYFETYPYLFINATKRSGKSRLLKLLAFVTNGIHTTSITEAVLFRLPMLKSVGLFIDEAERIGAKGKEALKDLLNAAYKRGVKIYRARKMAKTEKFTIDEFEVFVPIALANISGLDDVLSDRCIVIILERSYNTEIVNRPELFNLDEKLWLFRKIMEYLSEESEGGEGGEVKEIYNNISKFLIKHTNLNINLHLPLSSLSTHTTLSSLNNIIERLKTSNIIGRDLELWLPLFSVALAISEEEFNKILEIAKDLTSEKLLEDLTEDLNAEVLGFLSRWIKGKEEGFYLQKDIAKDYRIETESQLSSATLGKILKTLRLVKKKRRVGKGIEVWLDHEKILKLAKRYGIKIEEEMNFEKLPSSVQGRCSYCGEEKELEYKDSNGNYLCASCYEIEIKKG